MNCESGVVLTELATARVAPPLARTPAEMAAIASDRRNMGTPWSGSPHSEADEVGSSIGPWYYDLARRGLGVVVGRRTRVAAQRLKLVFNRADRGAGRRAGKVATATEGRESKPLFVGDSVQ